MYSTDLGIVIIFTNLAQPKSKANTSHEYDFFHG